MRALCNYLTVKLTAKEVKVLIPIDENSREQNSARTQNLQRYPTYFSQGHKQNLTDMGSPGAHCGVFPAGLDVAVNEKDSQRQPVAKKVHHYSLQEVVNANGGGEPNDHPQDHRHRHNEVFHTFRAHTKLTSGNLCWCIEPTYENIVISPRICEAAFAGSARDSCRRIWPFEGMRCDDSRRVEVFSHKVDADIGTPP